MFDFLDTVWNCGLKFAGLCRGESLTKSGRISLLNINPLKIYDLFTKNAQKMKFTLHVEKITILLVT